MLAGVFALLTLAAARSKGKAVAALGVSALLVGAAGWAGIEVGRRFVDDALNRTTGDIRTVAEAMVDPRRGQPASVAEPHAGRGRRAGGARWNRLRAGRIGTTDYSRSIARDIAALSMKA